SIAIYSLCENPQAVTSVPMGSGFILKAVFRTPSPTKRPKFGVVLRRRNTGEPVFGVNTTQAGVPQLSRDAQSFEISMTVDQLNLVQGHYTLDLYLGDEFRDFESILGAISIEVNSTNIFKNGYLPFPHTGPVYFLPKFEITEN
ncbi:MAG: Wzt carbohydrate-binding domain-containing protein, partial [Nitrososphaera sp.]|nr:Wzt carbohydrate-binding domain-containing protein [Nitrososphaera sp.]